MRKNVYFMNILLIFTVGFVCLADLVLRTFSPFYITPKPDLPSFVLLSFVPLMLEHYLSSEVKRNNPVRVLLAGITITLLPVCAGTDIGMPIWKLFVESTMTFLVTDILYQTIRLRMVSGSSGKLAPVVHGFILYLAAQCLQNLF